MSKLLDSVDLNAKDYSRIAFVNVIFQTPSIQNKPLRLKTQAGSITSKHLVLIISQQVALWFWKNCSGDH